MNTLVSITPPLRISSPEKEGVMRASKWLKHQLLVTEEEMRSLFEALSPFEIFVVSEPVVRETMRVKNEEFLECFDAYIAALKAGRHPDETALRRIFSTVFTSSRDALYAMEVGRERYLIKPIKPVIQLQLHHFFVSTIDGKFHPMVLGKESITWGIQFSYPQIYQCPKTQDFAKVVLSDQFPNSALFHKLVKWTRLHTQPTPFVFQGKKSNEPIRLGKGCFDWIGRHPGLKERGVSIDGTL